MLSSLSKSHKKSRSSPSNCVDAPPKNITYRYPKQDLLRIGFQIPDLARSVCDGNRNVLIDDKKNFE